MQPSYVLLLFRCKCTEFSKSVMPSNYFWGTYSITQSYDTSQLIRRADERKSSPKLPQQIYQFRLPKQRQGQATTHLPLDHPGNPPAMRANPPDHPGIPTAMKVNRPDRPSNPPAMTANPPDHPSNPPAMTPDPPEYPDHPPTMTANPPDHPDHPPYDCRTYTSTCRTQ